MTTTPPQPLPQSQLGWQEHGDEIDLREVFATLWRGKLVITAITLCVVATAVCITFAFDKRYDAAVVFTAVPDNGTSGSLGGGGGLGAQLGGLASLAGLSLSGNERKAEFLAVLQSQSLAERFITENNLLPVFFKDDWDSVLSQWENQEDAPTLWEAGQYFKKKVRRLTTDNKTGISTLTIYGRIPALRRLGRISSSRWPMSTFDLERSRKPKATLTTLTSNCRKPLSLQCKTRSLGCWRTRSTARCWRERGKNMRFA